MKIHFRGTRKSRWGHVPSYYETTIPEVLDTYSTVRYSTLENFSVSPLKVGETFEKDGESFRVTRNDFFNGDAATPSQYFFEAVPAN